MFVCTSCWRSFDEPKTIREPRGEHFGFPAFEEVEVCPYCRGDFEEADEYEGEEGEEEEEC